MVGLEDWLSVARAGDPDELRERILTGYRAGKPFTPYVPTIELPSRVGRVLDFGCGLGRNFPYLTSITNQIVGFDLPPMIEQCRALSPHPSVTLTSDWTEVCTSRYDLIFASLVLQHIETDACQTYVHAFARIAPLTYLLTRVHSDFDVNVLNLIADTGLFEYGDCTEVDHDEQTHQLRVLGTRRFDDVRRLKEGGHYEVLLHSR
jgi:trans-aconitate methyltransferase